MSEDVTDERADDIRVALRLDLDDVLAYVAHEALHVIMRCDPADRFTKENTLNGTSDLHLSTLAHGRRFAVPGSRPTGDAPQRSAVILSRISVVCRGLFQQRFGLVKTTFGQSNAPAQMDILPRS